MSFDGKVTEYANSYVLYEDIRYFLKRIFEYVKGASNPYCTQN